VLVRRGLAFMSEGSKSFVPCRHAGLMFHTAANSMLIRSNGIAKSLYNAVSCGINQRGRNGIQAKLRKRSS
jgi:hypothetical protein